MKARKLSICLDGLRTEVVKKKGVDVTVIYPKIGPRDYQRRRSQIKRRAYKEVRKLPEYGKSLKSDLVWIDGLLHFTVHCSIVSTRIKEAYIVAGVPQVDYAPVRYR